MKEIKLTQGQVTQVDDEDFEWLNQWKWYASKVRNTFYARRRKNKHEPVILMHRLILNILKGMETDHRDLNGLNNQRYNLRICTHQENMRNRKFHQGSSSKFKGCYWVEKDQRWRSQIIFKNEKTNLGSFISEIDAALAYDKVAKQLHGEFARLNFS